MLRLFLVRHAESTFNAESKENKLPLKDIDPKLKLTERGVKQAKDAGEFLAKYFNDNCIKSDDIYAYSSPYTRAIDTFHNMNTYLGMREYQYEKSDLIVEQNYGVFDLLNKFRRAEEFPLEYKLLQAYKHEGCAYYVKYPLGESAFDVSIRCRLFIQMMLNDIKRSGVNNIIITSHGVTLRCMYKELLRLDVDWYRVEPNPKNCSIRMIEEQENGKFTGEYIYKGDENSGRQRY